MTGDFKGRPVYIAGIGSFSPGKPIPFEDIDRVLGPITEAPQKTMKRLERMKPIMNEMLGIQYVYYAIDPDTRQSTETNLSMAVKASEKALAEAGIEPSDVDLLVYAGCTFDRTLPPPSTELQEILGIQYCAEMVIVSNCTSICKAMQVALDSIVSGRYETALIVSSQLSSSFLRSDFFNQAVLTPEQYASRWFLSDGAGAIVFSCRRGPHSKFRAVDTYLESVGPGKKPGMTLDAAIMAGNLRDFYDHGLHHLTQDMQMVAKNGPDLFARAVMGMILKTQVDVSRIKVCFPYVPTKHFMDVVVRGWSESLGQDREVQFFTRIATRGYQGPPTIIIALEEFLHEEKLNSGDLIAGLVTESSKWMHGGFILERC